MAHSDSFIVQKKKIQKSLTYSILDGAFWSAMVGFGESFFAAFAAFFKASNFQMGLIGSLPQSMGSLSQLLSNRFQRLFLSRQSFILAGVFLQAMMYIPIALV